MPLLSILKKIKILQKVKFYRKSPKVFCKDSCSKNFANFTENTCVGVSFL